MLYARFRIRLNITNLASKINYQCRSTNLTLGGPVQAGELPLKVFRQPYLHIYVPRREVPHCRPIRIGCQDITVFKLIQIY